MAAEPPHWRPARAGDADAIAALAAAALGPYGESAQVYAERIALAPEGCLVLEQGGAVLGHFISHPWPRGSAPEVDKLVGSLPAGSDCWHVHDAVISPDIRGGNLAGRALDMVAMTAAGRGFDRLSLIAVGGADRFWSRHGFAPAQANPPFAPDKVYMERPI